MAEQKLEQNQRSRPISVLSHALITGFVGGVFWAFIGYFNYVFHFTEISPKTVLDSWTAGNWKNGWLGIVFSLLIMGILGLAAAIIYYFAFRKFNSIWVGIAYGVGLFVIVFYLLNPLFPNLNEIHELKKTTIITTLCLYILFGVFVGYTISYEHYEKQEQEKYAGIHDQKH